MKRIFLFLIALTAFRLTLPLSAATTVAKCKSHLAGEVNVFADNAGEWNFSLESKGVKDNIEEFSLVAQAPDESTIPKFSVEFLLKRSDLQHHWDPSAERFPCSWTSQDSSFSTGLPIRANFDDDEMNVATWAVSDALNMIKFAEEHRDTLLFGRLIPHHPELGYPCVEAVSAEKRIVVVYQSEWIAKIPDDSKRVILVNATTADSLVIETKGGFKRINVKSGEYTELESYGL